MKFRIIRRNGLGMRRRNKTRIWLLSIRLSDSIRFLYRVVNMFDVLHLLHVGKCKHDSRKIFFASERRRQLGMHFGTVMQFVRRRHAEILDEWCNRLRLYTWTYLLRSDESSTPQNALLKPGGGAANM